MKQEATTIFGCHSNEYFKKRNKSILLNEIANEVCNIINNINIISYFKSSDTNAKLKNAKYKILLFINNSLAAARH